jgi:hypothetical protein
LALMVNRVVPLLDGDQEVRSLGVGLERVGGDHAGPAGATHGSVDELDRWPRLLDQDPIEAGVTQAILSAPGDQVQLHHAASRRAASHRVNVATRGPLSVFLRLTGLLLLALLTDHQRWPLCPLPDLLPNQPGNDLRLEY